MIETRLYIGLNDANTLKQEHETEIYVKVLKHVCMSYRVPFSFTIVQGGYIHENGEYTQEQTLVLSLINVNSKTVSEIAKDLCVFFHQESVMITEGSIRAYFINENIQKN